MVSCAWLGGGSVGRASASPERSTWTSTRHQSSTSRSSRSESSHLCNGPRRDPNVEAQRSSLVTTTSAIDVSHTSRVECACASVLLYGRKRRSGLAATLSESGPGPRSQLIIHDIIHAATAAMQVVGETQQRTVGTPGGVLCLLFASQTHCRCGQGPCLPLVSFASSSCCPTAHSCLMWSLLQLSPSLPPSVYSLPPTPPLLSSVSRSCTEYR